MDSDSFSERDGVCPFDVVFVKELVRDSENEIDLVFVGGRGHGYSEKTAVDFPLTMVSL